MGAAGFEPDIAEVHYLLVLGGVAAIAEEAFGRRGIPGIGAFLGKRAPQWPAS